MENILEKEPVKRVKEFIIKFDPKLKVLVLDTTARTAKDAAESLGCEVGAIVKSLVFRADDTFLICLVAGDKRCSLKKLNILIDQSLSRFTNVFAAAGHPNSIFKIEYNQLVQMTKGEIKEIIE